MLESLLLITLAGTPAIVTPSEKLLFTTALAPITQLFPILMSPKSLAPGPIYTLSPILGAPSP